MALQVWLPLTKDLSNQGIGNVIVTNNGATYQANTGKLGGSYYFDGNDWIKITIPSEISSIKNVSVCSWVKSMNNTLALGGISHDGASSLAGLTLYSSGWQISGNSSTWKYISSGTVANTQTWHHVCCTIGDNQVVTYLDGIQIAVGTLSDLGITTTNLSSSNFIEIGCDHPGGDEYLTGYVNDFRIYDHALSAKEVTEIAKGLVLHYPLNDQYNASNLVFNGYGEFGSDGWSGTTVSTSDLPTADTNIKATFLSGITDLFPINPKNTYTLQCYMKVNGSSSGYIYPSLYPYDIDGNFIDHYKCGAGFNTQWQATLTQPLKKGDTVLYCSDLSTWSTATNNYYYRVAIFGYKDSKGNVYPDFEYTQDAPAFGTYSDKSKINKTNNTITLNSAYTGEDRPAGTKICQSTEGGTYYYPWGGLESSNLTSWILKTATISFPDSARLRYAHYIRWSNYSNKAYYGGIKITDTTWKNTTVYDTSGFQNNGVCYQVDANSAIYMQPNSPRYQFGTNIKCGTSTVNEKSGTAYIRGDCVLTTPSKLTVAFWAYVRNEGYGGQNGQGLFCTSNNTGDSIGTDYQISAMNHRDGGVDVNDSSGNSHLRLSIGVVPNGWAHYAFTYDGQTAKSYRNGILQDTQSFSSAMNLGTFQNVVLGFSKAGGVWRKNNNAYSDLRVYITVLSPDAIKELFNTPISLSDNGTLFANEFCEY